jgi:hypothetical protein
LAIDPRQLLGEIGPERAGRLVAEKNGTQLSYKEVSLLLIYAKGSRFRYLKTRAHARAWGSSIGIGASRGLA